MARADSRRGIQRERDLVKRLREDEGWFAMRSPASLGVADVIALKRGERSRFYEVKSTAKGPYHSFGPDDRKALSVAARRAGADAILCWWPKNSQPDFIPEAEWPRSN